MRSNQFIPFLLLIAAALGCSAIRDLGSQGDAGNTSNSGRQDGIATGDAPGAFAPSGDPKADIFAVADRFLARDKFRAKMEGTGATPMNTELDFLAPDRFRLRNTLPNGQVLEMILIGNRAYMNAGGRWNAVPAFDKSMVPNMRETFTREGLKWFRDVKYEGEESAGGGPAYVYSYVGEQPGGGGEYSSKMWVAKSDGLPVKVTADYKTGALKTMKIVYDYEASITIDPPDGK